MKKYFVTYEQALALRDLGFDEMYFGKFYTKLKCKMFGVDEKGRHYPIKNTAKELYTLHEHYVLSESNLFVAPTHRQSFDWLLQKYSLYGIIIPTITMNWTFKTMTVVDDCIEVPPYNHVHAIDYSTFELAQSACLDELIKLAQNIKK